MEPPYTAARPAESKPRPGRDGGEREIVRTRGLCHSRERTVTRSGSTYFGRLTDLGCVARREWCRSGRLCSTAGCVLAAVPDVGLTQWLDPAARHPPPRCPGRLSLSAFSLVAMRLFHGWNNQHLPSHDLRGSEVLPIRETHTGRVGTSHGGCAAHCVSQDLPIDRGYYARSLSFTSSWAVATQ